MIRHLVMWKLDSAYSEPRKSDILDNMESKLIAMEGKVPVLKEISVVKNTEKAPGANHDIILGTLFENIEDLEAYQVHPLHQEVIAYFKTLKLQRAAIDYEI